MQSPLHGEHSEYDANTTCIGNAATAHIVPRSCMKSPIANKQHHVYANGSLYTLARSRKKVYKTKCTQSRRKSKINKKTHMPLHLCLTLLLSLNRNGLLTIHTEALKSFVLCCCCCYYIVVCSYAVFFLPEFVVHVIHSACQTEAIATANQAKENGKKAT